MAIQSTIDSISSNLSSAYSMVGTKGGTVPSAANMANLTNAINSIPVATLTTKNITTNGTYNASSDSADGYSSVSVNVAPNVGTKTITANGTYTASTDSLDGYSEVTVNVSGGGSGPTDITVTVPSDIVNSGKYSSFDLGNGKALVCIGTGTYLYDNSNQTFTFLYTTGFVQYYYEAADGEIFMIAIGGGSNNGKLLQYSPSTGQITLPINDYWYFGVSPLSYTNKDGVLFICGIASSSSGSANGYAYNPNTHTGLILGMKEGGWYFKELSNGNVVLSGSSTTSGFYYTLGAYFIKCDTMEKITITSSAYIVAYILEGNGYFVVSTSSSGLLGVYLCSINGDNITQISSSTYGYNLYSNILNETDGFFIGSSVGSNPMHINLNNYSADIITQDSVYNPRFSKVSSDEVLITASSAATTSVYLFNNTSKTTTVITMPISTYWGNAILDETRIFVLEANLSTAVTGLYAISLNDYTVTQAYNTGYWTSGYKTKDGNIIFGNTQYVNTSGVSNSRGVLLYDKSADTYTITTGGSYNGAGYFKENTDGDVIIYRSNASGSCQGVFLYKAGDESITAFNTYSFAYGVSVIDIGNHKFLLTGGKSREVSNFNNGTYIIDATAKTGTNKGENIPNLATVKSISNNIATVAAEGYYKGVEVEVNNSDNSMRLSKIVITV